MARPREYDDRVQVQLRCTPELRDRLNAAAEERDLSANFLVTRAIEQFLDRLIPVDEMVWTRERPPAVANEVER